MYSVFEGHTMTRDELRIEYDLHHNCLSAMRPFEDYIKWRENNPTEPLTVIPPAARKGLWQRLFGK